MDFFHLKPMISAGSLDAYFDTGNYDLSKISIEDIVSGWVGRGIVHYTKKYQVHIIRILALDCD
jgi:hypothetical protein